MSQGDAVSLGVFGGTFNPIHLGHLRAAEQVVELLGLERLLFVPSGAPPHKGSAALAPAELRLEWVEQSIRGNERFAVDALEVERAGPSFTVDTLREIGARIAPARPVFVIGCDALREIATWRKPEDVLALAHVAVMARPETRAGHAADLRRVVPGALATAYDFESDGESGTHRESQAWIRWLPIEPLDISATDIRARLSGGRSIRYLVPETILDSVSSCWTEAIAP
ncbi:MAG: nicotinate-nucleotide adenylyltransferase [Myxococcales bacterium]|nr:nicotinate-nucleotide adenylyltransferase [Myxococcales bacterium]